MPDMHKRWKDQDGILAKLHWILCQPIIAGMTGSLSVIAIAWVFGVFSTFPTTYAQKADIIKIEQKQTSDYRYLDERKLNKDDYVRAHELLRSEMKDGFRITAVNDDRILAAILSVRSGQILQNKKQDMRAKELNINE